MIFRFFVRLLINVNSWSGLDVHHIYYQMETSKSFFSSISFTLMNRQLRCYLQLLSWIQNKWNCVECVKLSVNQFWMRRSSIQFMKTRLNGVFYRMISLNWLSSSFGQFWLPSTCTLLLKESEGKAFTKIQWNIFFKNESR